MDEKQWSDIRSEYVTTNISYRQLSDKYGIARTTIYERAKKEKWVEKRGRYRSRADAKKEDIAVNAEARRYEKLVSVSNAALERIEQMLQKPDIDERGVRALMASLKDIKEIQGLRSTADAREQDARIANLERQATQNEEDKTTSVVVRIAGGTEDWGC